MVDCGVTGGAGYCFSEIATHLNGVSTPFLGVSWQPPVSDVAVARQLITFLEDSRALYVPYAVEEPDHVTSSILEVRQKLTDVIGHGGLTSDFVASLRTMRAACRKFTKSRTDGWTHRGAAFGGPLTHDLEFNQAVGEMRGVVGAEIAKVAVAHELDVEDQLVSIFPATDIDPV